MRCKICDYSIYGLSTMPKDGRSIRNDMCSICKPLTEEEKFKDFNPTSLQELYEEILAEEESSSESTDIMDRLERVELTQKTLSEGLDDEENFEDSSTVSEVWVE